MVRVAVVDHDLCKPNRCSAECVRFCPVNRSGGKAIELSEEVGGKALIYERACIGCGICVKKCPYEAISIVNLPDDLEKRVVHRYGPNAFKLYGLPAPQPGDIIGIVGRNGIGKSTTLRILSGELVPNLGDFSEPPSWDKVLARFRGTELHQFLSKVANKELRVVHKIQHVDLIRKYVKGVVKDVLSKVDERGLMNDVRKLLHLDSAWDNKVSLLSGGELQKFAIAAAILRDANAYYFDEPSSYLDVKERFSMAQALRDLLPKNTYVLIVEHDLTVLDYVSDHVTILYGEPGVYGIYSKIYSVGSGINHFLEGYL
ncbi:MAG: ribosome biogenesis/translation initiation ATPase RLI, partial [Desulfurococcales archaeon]|nr:ribosome biogenesis/translation initiation ATPase RLI [Desulfurococcales archaeon]